MFKPSAFQGVLYYSLPTGVFCIKCYLTYRHLHVEHSVYQELVLVLYVVYKDLMFNLTCIQEKNVHCFIEFDSWQLRRPYILILTIVFVLLQLKSEIFYWQLLDLFMCVSVIRRTYLKQFHIQRISFIYNISSQEEII